MRKTLTLLCALVCAAAILSLVSCGNLGFPTEIGAIRQEYSDRVAELEREYEQALAAIQSELEASEAEKEALIKSYNDRISELEDKISKLEGENEELSDKFKLDAIFITNDESGTVISERVLVGQKINAPEDPVLNGYEFIGWYINGEKVEFPYTVTDDVTFEAEYETVTYTIEYIVNDGTMPEYYETEYTVESGAELPIPARSLYIFDGWCEAEDFSTEKLMSIPVGAFGDKTLYAKWLSVTDGIIYKLLNGAYTVIGYEGSDTEIVIPSSVGGAPVTAIADSAFKGNQKITSITVPDSVTSIGDSAFEGCISLTKLDLGEGVTDIPYRMAYGCNKLEAIEIPDSVTSIGYYSFLDCDSLTSVAIPDSVIIIFPFAFSGCSHLTSVTIPGSVISIYASTFCGCSGLTSVTIPDSVTSIGDSAFSGCSGLTSVTIPDSITSIGYSAFSGCSGLTSVTIPDSVTSIGSAAFSGCSGLISARIGNSVTDIGSSTFFACANLISVTIGNSITSIGDYAFFGCSSLADVYYAGNEEEWEQTSIYSYGNDRLKNATRYYYSKSEPTIEGSFWHYGENGEILVW